MKNSNTPEYKIRLNDEASALLLKIQKLNYFITSKKFENIKHTQKLLLVDQLKVMRIYHKLLLGRLTDDEDIIDFPDLAELPEITENEKKPRIEITEEFLLSRIKSKKFRKLTNCLTICVITTINGFEVTGESACVTEEKYNKETGERVAFEKAKNKLWSYEGYLLKQQIYEKNRKK